MTTPRPLQVPLTRCLRDLEWAIGSPPLLHDSMDEVEPAETWANFLSASETLFAQLTQDTTPLTDELSRFNCHRLGLYFEGLLSYWLKHSGVFAVVKDHQPIYDPGSRRTIGEIDWLLADPHNPHQLQHWECAVKFYLSPAAPQSPFEYVGPRKRDSLGAKLKHMQSHQLTHTRRADLCKQLDINATTQKVTQRIVMKGRIFYPWHQRDRIVPLPLVSPLAETAYWLEPLHVSEFLAAQDKPVVRLIPLEKSEWISTLEKSECEARPSWTLTQNICEDHEFERIASPTLVAGMGETEVCRFFLVPKGWSPQVPQLGVSGNFP